MFPEVSAQCPACRLHALVSIQLVQTDGGNWIQIEHAATDDPLTLDTCPICFGAWFDRGELAAIGDIEVDQQTAPPSSKEVSFRTCPRGHGLMQSLQMPGVLRTPIERCRTCEGVWLDGHERRKLALASTREGQGPRSRQLARRGVIWALQLVTQLPVEVENPERGTPWIVYCLVGLLLAGFLLSVAGVFLYRNWALIGGRFAINPVHTVHTFVTYQFFHANWLHLLGNAYFLYLFGDNIEYLFGRLRFVLLFVGAGLVGGLLHVALSSATATPVIGASGAIAGVMAAYLWSFPNVRLFQVIPFTPIQVKIPAWVYLIVWVVFQAIMAVFSTALSFAWYSHLGGFAFGLLLTPWVLRWRRRQVARAVEVPAHTGTSMLGV